MKTHEKVYDIIDLREQILSKVERKKDKNQKKIYDEVFDHSTLLSIWKLISDNVIETIDYPVSTGKEGNVFKATGKVMSTTKKYVKRNLAVKIYRISNTTFRHIQKYISHDSRFIGIKKNRAKVIYAWAQREYSNLSKLYDANISVPKPITYLRNILVMDYIGDDFAPAPELRFVKLSTPERMFNTIMRMVKKSYRKAKIVHTDLSEYNILVWRNKPVFIDVAQGIGVQHPRATEMLTRDVENIVRYFRKFGISGDKNKILRDILK
jgi:RIO kinase 1